MWKIKKYIYHTLNTAEENIKIIDYSPNNVELIVNKIDNTAFGGF